MEKRKAAKRRRRRLIESGKREGVRKGGSEEREGKRNRTRKKGRETT